MIKLNYNKTSFSKPFRGTADNGLCILRYLRTKTKNACVINPYATGSSPRQGDISLRWSQSGGFTIPNGYWEQMTKCRKQRFIVFPFGFDCSNNLGHANYMIYDKYKRSLERFEPYGKSARTCLNPSGLDDKIKALFKANLGNDFIQTYYKPFDFLSKKGIQQIQEAENIMTSKDPQEGYCKAWCCWFVETRLDNPNLDRGDIIKLAINDIHKRGLSLTEYIRNYSQYVSKNC